VAADGDGTLLKLSNVSKAFSGHRVLKNISFEVTPGEFVALLGANGAGKSTLIKILDGVYEADSGEIWVGQKRVRSGDRGDLARIGVVHQDLGLVDELSVEENLLLGIKPSYLVLRPLRNPWAERRWVRAALQLAGLDGLDPLAKVGNLGIGPKTLVAVAKLLGRGAKVIIADETTSTMSAAEARWFTDRLRSHSLNGAAVLMVSHRLTEVIEAVDRHIVLRDGVLIADLSHAEASYERIAELIAGHSLSGPSGASNSRRAGEEVFALDDAATADVGPVSLSVRAGSITGVTGLTGSGLYEVALLAAGVVTAASGAVRRQHGTRLGFIPPDRDSQGVMADLTVRENVSLGATRRWQLPGGVINLAAERDTAQALLRQLKVVPDGLAQRQGNLSGGNQQKVLVGRALLHEPHLLVLCEPTRGVDIATRRQIHQIIHTAADDGVGVLMVSTDSEELVDVADTIYIMREGHIHRAVEAADTTPAILEGLL
jgi:ABC-type sugar transport system ATPase subunit